MATRDGGCTGNVSLLRRPSPDEAAVPGRAARSSCESHATSIAAGRARRPVSSLPNEDQGWSSASRSSNPLRWSYLGSGSVCLRAPRRRRSERVDCYSSIDLTDTAARACLAETAPMSSVQMRQAVLNTRVGVEPAMETLEELGVPALRPLQPLPPAQDPEQTVPDDPRHGGGRSRPRPDARGTSRAARAGGSASPRLGCRKANPAHGGSTARACIERGGTGT